MASLEDLDVGRAVGNRLRGSRRRRPRRATPSPCRRGTGSRRSRARCRRRTMPRSGSLSARPSRVRSTKSGVARNGTPKATRSASPRASTASAAVGRVAGIGDEHAREHLTRHGGQRPHRGHVLAGRHLEDVQVHDLARVELLGDVSGQGHRVAVRHAVERTGRRDADADAVRHRSPPPVASTISSRNRARLLDRAAVGVGAPVRRRRAGTDR